MQLFLQSLSILGQKGGTIRVGTVFNVFALKHVARMWENMAERARF